MKKTFFIIIALLILTIMTGCAPECTAEEILTFNPILESPNDGSVVSYANPGNFQWTHQESCVPYKYSIMFVNEDGTSEVDNFQEGDKTYLEKDTPFLPGKAYEWYVQGVHQEKDGNSVNYTYSPPSETRTFTTDGICSGPDLKQPLLIYPGNEAILDGGDSLDLAALLLKWIYPGDFPGDCHPESFHYQVAADPDFKKIITSGVVDAMCMITEPNSECWTLLSVPRCAEVYWRVEARTGNLSGAYSEPFFFTYASQDNCVPNQQPGNLALIKGFLFADYCWSTVPWVPDGVGIFPPCTFGEPYGVHADGNRNRTEYVHEVLGKTIPAEEGIPDILVDLGSGPCPSTGLNQMYTQNNGGYYFLVQSLGTYCLSISKTTNIDLDHGIWTLPLTNNPVAQVTVTLEEGDDLILQDFGWDQYDYLKIPFDVEVISFCRAGDSKAYPEVAIFEAGTEIPVIARNQDATWFATVVDGRRCFISIASGSPRVDPSDLLIYPVQPPPEEIEENPCAEYTNRDSCLANDCQWTDLPGAGICTQP
jgi:hypothetical protein